jgi:uncharacterized SAM-binding protein YcdF (DUF218 family)
VKKHSRLVLRLLIVGLLAWLVSVTGRIVSLARIRPLATKADVALVLGASAHAGVPSPVFAGRIDYAVELFHSGQAGILLFTGGRGKGETVADAEAAKSYAIGKGVPAGKIWIETSSRTTRENIAAARRLLKDHPSASCLLVSDPLHMFRASLMMRDAGLAGTPAPSPYTRIHSLWQKLVFLGREVALYHVYLVSGQ